MSSIAFARQALRNWQEVGAVTPSSPELAKLMSDLGGVPTASRVVELGPGTGALTEIILREMSPEADYLGIELNKDFVRALQQRYPGRRFEAASAQSFDFHQAWPDGTFDVIISGLPWASFPTGLQQEILDHVLGALKPGGVFVTFAYWGFHRLPAAIKFKETLLLRTEKLTRSHILWRNMPPAFVYTARKAAAVIEPESQTRCETTQPEPATHEALLS